MLCLSLLELNVRKELGNDPMDEESSHSFPTCELDLGEPSRDRGAHLCSLKNNKIFGHILG